MARGAGKTRINRQRYKEYVADLEARNEKFPVSQFGEVNLSAVADACGFGRQVFFNNASMREQLNEDIKRIGTTVHAAKDPDSVLAQKAESKSREASQLRKQLEEKIEEVESLRKLNEELKEEIRKLENSSEERDKSMDEMLESGRRFFVL